MTSRKEIGMLLFFFQITKIIIIINYDIDDIYLFLIAGFEIHHY